MALMLVSKTAYAQKALIDDERAYSAKDGDRAYVAARCAALYMKMAEGVATTNDTLSKRKASEAREFLRRLPPPPESVFLEWSTVYGRDMAKSEANLILPAKTLYGRDYATVCASTLLIIRDGDHMGKYSRAELKYLFEP